MNISRPCYDKPHRCPGWAGPAFKYPKDETPRCRNGRAWMYNKRDTRRQFAWSLRTHRCDECNMIILPFAIRWVDPAWLKYMYTRHKQNRDFR